VAELAPLDVAVVLCGASSDALDALVAPGHGTRTCRTAPDEALFVCHPDVSADVVRELADRVAALDDDAVVLDVSDSWAAWTLRGTDVRGAFAYVSHLEVPDEGFAQGTVAHVAAKILVDDDGLTLLVPAYWHDHVRERLIRDARVTEAAR
jgi:hypothetical protein